MFGMGMPEILLILAVALIVIGPKKLPDLAKSLGRAMGEFKRATSEFKETMEIDSQLSEVRKTFDEMNDDVRKKFDDATASDPVDVKTPSAPPPAGEEASEEPAAADTEIPPETVPSAEAAPEADTTEPPEPEKRPADDR